VQGTRTARLTAATEHGLLEYCHSAATLPAPERVATTQTQCEINVAQLATYKDEEKREKKKLGRLLVWWLYEAVSD
jgi:hypothetical protein